MDLLPEAFWRQALLGFRVPTPLLTVVPAPGTNVCQEPGQGHEAIQLPAALTSALQALARQHGLTLNTLVQGAWAVLLGRYSGEEDVVFGATRACRHFPVADSASMVGLFINTLPVRAQLAGDKPVLSFLQELRAQSVAVRPFEHTPLLKVQEWSELPRGQSLFDSLVVFENYLLNDALHALGDAWQHRDVQLLQETDYPLVLTAFAGSELVLDILYQRPRFDTPTVARMLGHLRTLLEGMLADPQRPLATLSLLTEAERRQVLLEWNRTQADYPDDRCIHELFEEQVARTPDSVALVFEKQYLTYRELNRRANQLANYLRARGVGPEVLVGLSTERSVEMIIGLLGILKAGGAYVPLDPAYPSDRLAAMIQDAQLKVLLTQTSLLAKLPEASAQVICLDAIGHALARESEANPACNVKIDNLAYVIYTSGSTGQPKGVLVEHRGLGNLAQAQIQGFAVRPSSRVLQFASLSFDASVSEVFMALLAGATLVVPPPGTVLAGPALLTLLHEQAVSHVTLSPSVLAVLPADPLPALETLIVAGEACSADLVARWSAGRRFVNAYGPTEVTVCATLGPCTDSSRPPSIGRPIANTQVYLLDRYQQPVPVGVPGEIYIGSVGLARGYRHRPDLTTAKFVPNPFRPGTRLYRTGDLARWLPNGELDFLGRIDHQVKIRGFRIELGEIETILDAHPSVRASVVLARPDGAQGNSLVAYVIAEAGHDLSPDALRRHLQAKLPQYMVPSHFVPMKEFPLSPNGKIDRKALPAPDRAAVARSREIVAPRTDAERDLLAIWEDVLKLKPLGVTENFFDLGGHSLSAVLVMGKIKAQLGHALPLGTLFQAPTVEKLAALLQNQLEAGSESSIVPLQDQGSLPPLFLFAGVGGHVFTFHKFARLLGPEQPAYGVKAIGIDGAQESPDRVQELADHYVKAITALRPEGPYLLAGYSVGGLVAYEVACRLRALGRPVALLAVFDTNAPGYPKKFSWGKRLGMHLCALARGNLSTKRAYLRERLNNVKGRLLTRAGLGVWNAPHIQAPAAFSQTKLKKVWAALNKAGATYVPEQPYDGKIELFKVERGEQWAATVFDDPLMGWQRWTTGKVEAHSLPGAHLEVFEPQHIRLVADTMNACIRTALAEAGQRPSPAGTGVPGN